MPSWGSNFIYDPIVSVYPVYDIDMSYSITICLIEYSFGGRRNYNFGAVLLLHIKWTLVELVCLDRWWQGSFLSWEGSWNWSHPQEHSLNWCRKYTGWWPCIGFISLIVEGEGRPLLHPSPWSKPWFSLPAQLGRWTGCGNFVRARPGWGPSKSPGARLIPSWH